MIIDPARAAGRRDARDVLRAAGRRPAARAEPRVARREHRWIYDLAGSVGPVPGALFTIGAPLLIWVGLKYVPFRRLLFAVGSNDATAFSAGVNVTAVRIASYGLGGLFAGIGGLSLDRARAFGERGQLDAVRAARDRGARARRHVARGRPRRADRRRLRRLLDLPAAEPARELPGQPGWLQILYGAHPDRRPS